MGLFDGTKKLLGICEEEVKELKDKINDILRRRNLENKYLKSEIIELKKEVELLKKESHKEELSKNNNLIIQKDEEIVFLKKRIVYLVNKVENLVVEKNELNDCNTKSSIKLEDLKVVEKKLQELSEEKSEYIKKIEFLEEENQDILNKSRNEKEHLESKIVTHKKDIELLKKETSKESNSLIIVSDKDKLNDFNTKYAIELEELKALEEKLKDLNEEKSEYLNDISEFNRLYNVRLGDIIRKILKWEEEQLQNAIDEKQKQYDENQQIYNDTKNTIAELEENMAKLQEVLDSIDKNHEDYDEVYEAYEELKEECSRLKDELNSEEEALREAKKELEDDPIFEEYEEAKSSYEEYDSEYEDSKEIQDNTNTLDEDEKKELKKLFRKASRLCHPDLVTKERKEIAHKLMQELNDAYSKKEIKSVKKILKSLENETVFILPSDSINNIKVLKAKIDELRESISNLEVDVEEIKEDNTFEIIQNIDDMDEYFDDMYNELEAKYNNLTTNTSEYKPDTLRSDEYESLNYFSTTVTAKKHNIDAKPHLFDRLTELDLIYKNSDGKYRLTSKGENIGGKYAENEEGNIWIIWGENSLDEIIEDLKENLGYVSSDNNELTPHQLEVHNHIIRDINAIFDDGYEDDKISLSGSAGVGKTFLTIKIIEQLQNADMDLVVTAPTHKALSVITDSLKRYGIKNVTSKTIHSFLNLKLKIDEESGEKLFVVDEKNNNSDRVDILIVDESSMIGNDLFDFINNAIASSRIGAVLFVGDPYQLPPVNSEKNSIFELNQSYFLEQIIRQKEDSYIINIATKIRDCIINKDFTHKIESFFSNNIDDLKIFTHRDEFLDEYYKDAKYDWYERNQIIADYTNNSVEFYNRTSRKKYWEDKGNLEPKQFENGDVVVFQDSYVVEKEVKYQNGSVVKIKKCSKEFDDSLNIYYWLCTDAYGDDFKVIDNPSNPIYMNMLQVKIEDAKNATHGYHRRNKWIEYYALKERYANVKFNYASTIHKLQGSTYETVFIDIRKMINLYNYSNQVELEFLYRLLYVSVTRASENIVILK